MSDPRDAAISIVRLLQQRGHVAYLAGGCVRDRLRGVEPKDYDVATDARPELVRKLFRKTQFVGEAFGVVIVHVGGERVEVATFRTEWGYEDGRRPTHVEFSDAEHDARRRDFTINGLFEDPIAERVIDHVEGQADLSRGIVRAIGDPQERFAEDYLRMLRAPRFAAALGFRLERKTAAAIRQFAPKLGIISRERIGQEVRNMLTGRAPARAARLMQKLALDGPALNEANLDVRLPTLRRIGPEPAYPAALAAWALDRYVLPALDAQQTEKELPALLRRWRAALCLSNDECDALRDALTLWFVAQHWSDLGVAKRKRTLAHAVWPIALALLQATGLPGVRRLARRIERDAKPLIAEGVAPTPLVTGDDLIRLGRKPGPVFGRLLEEAYDAQLEGRLVNREAALGWLAKQPGDQNRRR